MRVSSFTIITLFFVLTILGLFLVPKVPLRLKPSPASQALSVNFNWPDASAEIVESQATSQLEAIFSTLGGLTKITSRSGEGFGEINMVFDKTAEMEAVRFEVSALIRQARQDYPEGMDWPVIGKSNVDNDKKTIMTFTLNGDVPSSHLQKFAQENLKPLLGNIKGLSNVNVYGASQKEWVLAYDQLKLNSLGISKNDLIRSLSNHFNTIELGMAQMDDQGKTWLLLRITGINEGTARWENIPVIKTGERILFITDLCKIQYKERLPASYYRINGLNTINIVLSAGREENELVLGKQIKEAVSAFELPEGYNILVSYDSTRFLQQELDTIIFRSGLSLLILIIFTFLVSLSFRYLSIVIVCIFVNLVVAFTLYFLAGVELQLYSLAGITISLGIIIDNTFVMIDHVRHQGNKKVFIAILAATLTTIGALSVIFFMKEDQKLILVDFALVLIINLSVSLAVAWFLAPALLEKLPLNKKGYASYHRRYKKWAFRSGRFYGKFVAIIVKYKKVVIIIAVLSFGLPWFLLPERSEKDTWYGNLYNYTLGSDWYRENLHPYMSTWLGGTMTLFKNNVYNKSYYGEPHRTTLYYRGRMPSGTTVQQMNEVFLDIENFLSQFSEIQTFQTKIYSPQEASISIHFKKEYENNIFPYFLKSKIEQKAISMGGLDSQVYGVGKGFSNSLNSGYKNSRIYLYGYNYEVLMEEAQNLKSRLLTYARIKEVDINSEFLWQSSPLYEYIFDLNKEYLALRNISPSDVFNLLHELSLADVTASYAFINNEYIAIRVRPEQASNFDLWNINELPIKINNETLKLGNVATVRKERAREIIFREDQQYRLIVEYDFIGSPVMQEKVLAKSVAETNLILPLGYLAKEQTWSGWSAESEMKQYSLVFLVVGIVFVMGAVLLESLKKALVIVFMIPVSFIGVFLTFYWFDLNFDQGGYASFLLLSGLTVNSGFYVVNDFNIFIEQKKKIMPVKAFVKAFQYKIIPVLLTIISTVAGLLPFLAGGQNNVFWFALAAGTIGGLLFSLISVLCLLPLILPSFNDQE